MANIHNKKWYVSVMSEKVLYLIFICFILYKILDIIYIFLLDNIIIKLYNKCDYYI